MHKAGPCFRVPKSLSLSSLGSQRLIWGPFISYPLLTLPSPAALGVPETRSGGGLFITPATLLLVVTPVVPTAARWRVVASGGPGAALQVPGIFPATLQSVVVVSGGPAREVEQGNPV